MSLKADIHTKNTRVKIDPDSESCFVDPFSGQVDPEEETGLKSPICLSSSCLVFSTVLQIIVMVALCLSAFHQSSTLNTSLDYSSWSLKSVSVTVCFKMHMGSKILTIVFFFNKNNME